MILWTILLLFISCDLTHPGREVTIRIPPWPERFPVVSYGKLSWLNPQGEVSTRFSTPGEEETLLLQEDIKVILFTPYTLYGEALYPVGFLALPGETLALSYPLGPFAKLVLDWVEAGNPWEALNWNRIASRGLEVSQGQPIFLDWDYLLQEIREGGLGHYSFHTRVVHQVLLPGGPGAEYYFQNPWAGACQGGSQAFLLSGQNLYWDERGQKKALWLDSQGHIINE